VATSITRTTGWLAHLAQACWPFPANGRRALSLVNPPSEALAQDAVLPHLLLEPSN